MSPSGLLLTIIGFLIFVIGGIMVIIANKKKNGV